MSDTFPFSERKFVTPSKLLTVFDHAYGLGAEGCRIDAKE